MKKFFFGVSVLLIASCFNEGHKEDGECFYQLEEVDSLIENIEVKKTDTGCFMYFFENSKLDSNSLVYYGKIILFENGELQLTPFFSKDTVVLFSTSYKLMDYDTQYFEYNQGLRDRFVNQLFKIKYDNIKRDTIFKFRVNGIIKDYDLDYVFCYSKRQGIVGVYVSSYIGSDSVEEVIYSRSKYIYLDSLDSTKILFDVPLL